MTERASDGDGAGCDSWLEFRNMRLDEVCQVVDIWQEQGMAQGTNNVKNFYEVDPEGFFVAVDTRTGEVVATCACVRQTPSLLFIGQYAVRKKLQGRGVGRRLWKVMENRWGDCNVGLGAVPEYFPMYRDKAGLSHVESWATIVYNTSTVTPERLPTPPDDLRVVPIDETLMPQVIAYDTLLHGYDRGKMIRLTMGDEKGISRAVVQRQGGHDVVCGFGKINSNIPQGAVASPIYARDREVAAVLLRDLVKNKPEAQVRLAMFVPDCNRDACSLAEDLGLTEYMRVARCYRKESVSLRLELVYSQHDLNFCIA
ncbi:unnamed protein product [Ixodes persulcatus]